MKFQNDRRACRVLRMCSIFPPFPFRMEEEEKNKSNNTNNQEKIPHIGPSKRTHIHKCECELK